MYFGAVWGGMFWLDHVQLLIGFSAIFLGARSGVLARR
jgi:hypothetical protein